MTRLLAAVSALLLSSCDVFGDGTVAVRGHVVDDVTGEALDPGPAFVSVYGTAFLSSSEAVLQGEAAADGRFDLSGEIRDGVDVNRLRIGSAGRIEYPGADTSAVAVAFGIDRSSYFAYESSYSGGRNVGEIRLLPTCLTLGDIRLSRPLAASENLVLRMASAQAVPRTSDFSSYTGRRYGEGELPSPLRLYGVGGREARLEWELGQYAPPTGNGQTGIARGVIDLSVCPRHGVLRYTAAIPLP